MKNAEVELAVRRWLETVVIGFELCPFAQRELEGDRVRFAISPARNEAELLQDLEDELNLMFADGSTATTLLIHPGVLTDFDDYNQFLDLADALLEQMQFSGVFQIASFHPDYRFAGSEPGDAGNFTNRSPYPMLHILREDSVTRAIDSMPDVEQVPLRNVDKMNELGAERLERLLRDCRSAAGET